jgi:hypothetical protein
MHHTKNADRTSCNLDFGLDRCSGRHYPVYVVGDSYDNSGLGGPVEDSFQHLSGIAGCLINRFKLDLIAQAVRDCCQTRGFKRFQILAFVARILHFRGTGE